MSEWLAWFCRGVVFVFTGPPLVFWLPAFPLIVIAVLRQPRRFIASVLAAFLIGLIVPGLPLGLALGQLATGVCPDVTWCAPALGGLIAAGVVAILSTLAQRRDQRSPS
jgi:hypothetical protein